MPTAQLRPYLIAQDDEGQFRITIRETRYNSQGYPLVKATLQEETFKSVHAARTFAREHLGAQAGEFALK
ncbi:hypothetical protein E2493_01860 [Sphingomonas parva]|uniref:WGR domain-containing protein n=1 Tax=Sphingomonas parva TaxID=2555898 RepID=A0A4Y8ZVG2_9SPHN|nr:hypothetical protein [Sphingomonas parva]TFI60018.1 hypothetical protein E2493_01860 [Sphingomonas parva]